MIKYPKIYRLGHVETQDILSADFIEITEKIDGANCRIGIDTEGNLWAGGRNNHCVVTEDSEMGKSRGSVGLHKYVRSIETALRTWFDVYPETVLVGEWTRKHHIYYGEINDRPRIIFYDAITDNNVFSSKRAARLREWALYHSLQFSEPLYQGPPLSEESIEEMVNRPSKYNPSVQMEGIVIKAGGYRNQYGRGTHAKLVNSKFSEISGARQARSSKSKTLSDDTRVIEQFITEARVRKIVAARQDPAALTEADMKWLVSAVFDDIMSEETLTISRQVGSFDFKQARQIVGRNLIKFIHTGEL